MVVVGAVVVAGGYYYLNGANSAAVSRSPSPAPSFAGEPSPSVESSAGQNSPIQSSPKAQTQTSPSPTSQANIIVSQPKPNQQITLPLTVKGQARVFENQFSYRVKDETGEVLDKGSVTANSPDMGQFGPFEINIKSIALPKSHKLTIELFSNSAKDGTEQDLVVIPVELIQI